MVPRPDSDRIRRNLDAVRARIARSLELAGRRPSEVTLVGVTKLVSIEEAAILMTAGCIDLGENRPEQLVEKALDPQLMGAIWHLIGTFQRRKVRNALATIAMVHSVDSHGLAEAISRRAVELNRCVPVLIQVNVSGETSKHGLAPIDVQRDFDRFLDLKGIDVKGLMTMAPAAASETELRTVFASCRRLRDALETTTRRLPFLSMGMSSDFVPAILEGATHVRIGSSLFGDT